MRAVSTSELVSILCDGRKVEAPNATLRVTLTHADRGISLSQLPVWLRWPDPEQKEPADPITPGVEARLLGTQSRTDRDGAVTFCGVPSNTRLELVMLLPDDDPEVPQGAGARFSRIGQFVVLPGEVTSRTASVRPPEKK
jgi:hypothetical protein